jgi:hypothetical protein
MIHRPLLKIPLDLPIILTHMPRIPPIATTPILAVINQMKRRRCALERYIARAHDRLAQVLEAVVNVPRHLDVFALGQFERVVCLKDGVQAVQLVGERSGVDGLSGIVVDWVREVVVFFWVFDLDVAQAF